MSELSTVRGAALERTPQRIGEEIRSLTYQAKCMTVYFGVEIGRRLVEAKELVGHGGWGNFVQNETEFSQATASRFMKVFEAYGADQIGIFGAEAKSSTLQNLSISNALRLLAVPEEERENFALAVDAEHISARELEKVIRERDQARASEKTAEESRAKMEQDMAMLKQLHEAAAHGEEKARAELDRVKRELAELREKPVEVAVEVKDAAPEQLDQAREEARKAAEQAWRDKLSAAEKKLSDASKEKKTLEDRVAKLQKAAKSGDGLSDEVERLKKELALANTGLATFKAKLEGMNAAFSGVNQALSALEADVRPKMVAALRAQFAAWEKELEEKKQC